MSSKQLLRVYYRKHGVTLYKAGFHIHAFQVFYKNSKVRNDIWSLLYLCWMLSVGKGCIINPKLAVKILQKIMKYKEKLQPREVEETEKLLSFCYLNHNIKYADKMWAGWTLASGPIMDLRAEDSF